MSAQASRTAAVLIVMAALIAVPLLVQGGSGTDDQAEAVARQFAGAQTEPTVDAPADDAGAAREQMLFVGQGLAGLAALAWALRISPRA